MGDFKRERKEGTFMLFVSSLWRQPGSVKLEANLN